jgi:N-acetyl-alpha-D-muramate 1-phosphate uridylyltransferase
VDALILAAGHGTRLRPLTDTVPKALVEIAGEPILARVARRLVEAGADRLIVNVHHLADRLEAYLESADLGAEVVISREEERALETGGGVRHAARHFRRDAPFFVHNGDILTDLPLRDLYAAHLHDRPLATLAVMNRESTRRLVFDQLGLLGWANTDTGQERLVRPVVGERRALPFTGVHVIDPDFLDLITEKGAFSIWDPYLRLVEAGYAVLPFEAGAAVHWFDIGRPEQLEEARRAYDPGREEP